MRTHYVYCTRTNGSDPQHSPNWDLALGGRLLHLPALPISPHLFLLSLGSQLR